MHLKIFFIDFLTIIITYKPPISKILIHTVIFSKILGVQKFFLCFLKTSISFGCEINDFRYYKTWNVHSNFMVKTGHWLSNLAFLSDLQDSTRNKYLLHSML